VHAVTPVDTQKLLKIGPAAALVGVSVDTLRRWSDEGKVPFQRTPGKQRLFDRTDLLALLSPGSPATPSPEAGER